MQGKEDRGRGLPSGSTELHSPKRGEATAGHTLWQVAVEPAQGGSPEELGLWGPAGQFGEVWSQQCGQGVAGLTRIWEAVAGGGGVEDTVKEGVMVAACYHLVNKTEVELQPEPLKSLWSRQGPNPCWCER